jgi:hypothetical protein
MASRGEIAQGGGEFQPRNAGAPEVVPRLLPLSRSRRKGRTGGFGGRGRTCRRVGPRQAAKKRSAGRKPANRPAPHHARRVRPRSAPMTITASGGTRAARVSARSRGASRSSCPRRWAHPRGRRARPGSPPARYRDRAGGRRPRAGRPLRERRALRLGTGQLGRRMSRSAFEEKRKATMSRPVVALTPA